MVQKVPWCPALKVIDTYLYCTLHIPSSFILFLFFLMHVNGVRLFPLISSKFTIPVQTFVLSAARTVLARILWEIFNRLCDHVTPRIRILRIGWRGKRYNRRGESTSLPWFFSHYYQSTQNVTILLPLWYLLYRFGSQGLLISTTLRSPVLINSM